MDPLVKEAIEARKKSYSPYSKFAVGAALETADGTVITGTNVEHVHHGMACCAERTALFTAVAQGHRKFKRLAVVADTQAPVTPCGICRQFLVEFNPHLEIIMANLTGQTETATLDQL